MNISNLIPDSVKMYVAGGLAILLFVFGWHAHVIWTEYKQESEKTKVIEDLGKSQTEIIDFNQKFDKGEQDAKKTNTDNCLDKSIPSSIRVLLTSH